MICHPRWERVQSQNSHLGFPPDPEKLQHKMISFKVQCFEPNSNTTGNAPGSSSTVSSERYRSSIGFVWMVPYGCPSASQMLLPFLSNYTQALGSLFTQGTGASPRLVYPPLLLFTFCLTSASLPCYFSILVLERKNKSFSAYLCQVIIPDFKTSRKHPLFFLFPQAEPQSSLPFFDMSRFINLIILVILEHSLPSNQ